MRTNKNRLTRLLTLGLLRFNVDSTAPTAGDNGAPTDELPPADTGGEPSTEPPAASKEGEGTPGTEGIVLGGDLSDASDPPTGGDPATDGANAGDSAATTAPETYDDFTLPEGMELDQAYLGTLTSAFKDAGLSQEQAQKLIDFQAAQIKAGDEARVQAFNQLTQDWLTAARADKEIGGDAFDQNVANARLAVEKFGTPDLNKLLQAYGIGNHPEVIRTFARVGKLLREDQLTDPLSEPKSPTDVLATLYPNNARS